MLALRNALGYLRGFDLSFSCEDVMPFRAYMRDALPKRFAAAQVCYFGHLGDGGVHFNIVLPRSDGRLTDNVEAMREFAVTTAVERFGTSFSAGRGLGPRNQHCYASNIARRLARVFKAHTSPAPLCTINLEEERTDDFGTGNPRTACAARR
jgi:hypothetical protein